MRRFCVFGSLSIAILFVSYFLGGLFFANARLDDESSTRVTIEVVEDDGTDDPSGEPEDGDDAGGTTFTIPDTGFNAGFGGNVASSRILFSLSLAGLLLAFSYHVLMRKLRKTRLLFTTEKRKARKLSNAVTPVLALSFVVGIGVALRSYVLAVNLDNGYRGSEGVHIVVKRGGDVATATDTILLDVPEAKSYRLYAYIKNEDRIVDEKGNYIDSFTDHFDDNVLGYSVGDSDFAGLPGWLAKSGASSGSGNFEVTYGIRANEDLPVGTYRGTISYVVLADLHEEGSAEVIDSSVSKEGGDTIEIVTSILEYGNVDLGNPVVKIGDKDCTGATIVKNSDGSIHVTCTTPQYEVGKYDLTISIPSIGWAARIDDGVEYVDNNAHIIEVGNESCVLYANDTDRARDNSICLQHAIDEAHRMATASGNTEQQTVNIPEGAYYFAWTGMRTKRAGAKLVYDVGVAEYYCVKLRSNVKLVGGGNKSVLADDINPDDFTIFYPYDGEEFYDNEYRGEDGNAGDEQLPSAAVSRVDMFYYNDYADYGFDESARNYLVNADFANFVIDSRYATASTLRGSAGKGFMVNLFDGCDWDNIAVMNTDGTGFGMDCAIDSSIKNSLAVGCGKGEGSSGNSGFGIGAGYADTEKLTIDNSRAYYNYQYGFFFEHQGKWKYGSGDVYSARIIGNTGSEFIVRNSSAGLNGYDFGGERAYNLHFSNINSNEATTYSKYVSSDVLKQRQHSISPVLLSDLSTNITFNGVSIERSNYNDLENDFIEAKWAISRNIVTPTSETLFGASDTLNRGEVLSMLWRYFNRTNENLNDGESYLYYNNATIHYREPIAEFGGANYKSISRTDHTNINDVYIAIDWALDNGVSNGSGYSDGALRMDIDGNCTKMDYIVFLYRLSGENIGNSVGRSEIIEWANRTNVFNGDADDLSLDEAITKLDAVKILYRYNEDNTVNRPS